MAESFFATLEHELLARHGFKTKAQAKTALFTYIESLVQPAAAALGHPIPVDDAI